MKGLVILGHIASLLRSVISASILRDPDNRRAVGLADHMDGVIWCSCVVISLYFCGFIS